MQKSFLNEHEDVRLHILAEVSQQITSILDINELLVQVVRLVQQTFYYYHVGIGLIEEDEVVYRVGAGVLWDDPMFQFKPARLKIGSEGISGWVARTGKPALVSDVSLDPHYVWMQGSLTRSELTVPIIAQGKTIGVLDVQSQRLDDFEQTDIELMQAIANQAGIAIENARLFAETQRLFMETERRANKLAIINSVQQGLASKLDVQSIYELVGDKFRDIFDAQVVVISTYDQQSNSVEHRYAIERGVRIPWPGKHPPGGFRSQIIQTRKPLLFNINVAEEAARLRQPILQGTATPKSWLGAPMLAGEQVIGILSVQSLERENAFDESDVRLLQTFAASMSIALENARLFSQTERRAEQFRVLTEVSQHIISLTSVDELLKEIAKLVKETFGYIHVGIGLVKDNYVISKAEVGAFEAAYHAISIPLGEGIWGRVAQEGISLLTNHVSAETNYEHMHNIGIRSHLCVPLKIKDKMIGVMSAASDRNEAFDQSDEIILQTLANQVSVAIENARLYENAKEVAVLEERQRLARELHDSVTQSLYGIELYSQAALGNLSIGKLEHVDKNLKDIHETSQEALAEMRLLIYELRPPILEKEGLVAVLQARLSAVEGRAGLKVKFKSELTERVSIAIEDGLCHIAQEALNNVLKHAHAQNVSVDVGLLDGIIILAIVDDGVGFDLQTVTSGGLGLVSMREHAEAIGGKLSVFSQPNHGTQVTVEVEA